MYNVHAPDFLILFKEKNEWPKKSLSYFEAGTHGYPRVYLKKSMGMGWVGFVSEFHRYFRVGYPKRLVILGSFGYQTRG